MRSGNLLTPCSPWELAQSLLSRLPFVVAGLLLMAVLMRAPLEAKQMFSDFSTPLPLPPGHTLVIGIAGGWEAWDAEHNLTRRITLRLREKQLANVHVETVENHHLGLARQLIEKALAGGGEHKLVIFGHSLGGAAALKLARWCEKRNIPVELTLQIDSVGLDDEKVPANVRYAANLFQSDSLLLRGEKEIRAADPARTKILGNFRYRYPVTRLVPAAGAPWYFNLLQHPHIKMEYDPVVWLHVESLLLRHLAR